MSGDEVRCPCKKCHNIKYTDVETVKLHLFRFGFVENYFVWTYQGEKEVIDEMSIDLPNDTQPGLGYDNPYRQMILDAAGSNFCQDYILPCAFSQVGKTISNVVRHLKFGNVWGLCIFKVIFLVDMTRGRGRGNTTRASKTLIRGRGSTSRVNMPTVPIPIANSHQGGINSSAGPDQNNQFQTLAPTSSPPIQTSAHGSTPSVNFETPSVISNQSNAIGESTSTQRNVIREVTISSQNNTIGEGESNNNSGQQTLVFLSHSGICESFKSELDPNGINWKSVSQEIKDFYLREFKKQFYWDPSIDSEVEILWCKKAARRYSDFISCIIKVAIWPKYVSEETWESWIKFWKDPKVIEKPKMNSKNSCGGQNVVAKGTHTGGSITIGEHRYRLAIEKGRDPTPSKLYLHVHTHGHDGKSFVGERARNVHVYQATVEVDGDKGMLEKVIKPFNLYIPPRELQKEDPKSVLQSVMSCWLPLSDTLY
uniref:PttA2 protein, putative n=1 Tax=Solanum demissum TaxID=50514 RepID=Q6L3I8_SOLDE|nr:PttA2 protein, putative [Solanum demissum]